MHITVPCPLDGQRRLGSRQGVHYWNRLPDGTEIDLTRQQFAANEVIQPPRVLRRPDGPPKRCAEQYLTMRRRVLNALGIPENHAASLLRGRDAPGARSGRCW
jgi:hypothetical protein